MPEPPPYPGTPRWVKVSGIIVIVLVLLVVIIMVTGVGGAHGPGRHMPSGAPGSHTPSGSLGGDIPPEAGPVRARFESYTICGSSRTLTGHLRISTPACRAHPEARLGMGPAGEGIRQP